MNFLYIFFSLGVNPIGVCAYSLRAKHQLIGNAQKKKFLSLFPCFFFFVYCKEKEEKKNEYYSLVRKIVCCAPTATLTIFLISINFDDIRRGILISTSPCPC